MDKYYWAEGGVRHGAAHLAGGEVDFTNPLIQREKGSLISAGLIIQRREVEKKEAKKKEGAE